MLPHPTVCFQGSQLKGDCKTKTSFTSIKTICFKNACLESGWKKKGVEYKQKSCDMSRRIFLKTSKRLEEQVCANRSIFF